MILYLFLASSLLGYTIGTFPIPYVKPETCEHTQYFDPTCMTCKQCGLGKDGQENLQLPSEDGSLCLCKPQFFLKERKGPHDITCSKCHDKSIPSLNGRSCIECGVDNEYNETIKSCEPCHLGITVEAGETRSCASCSEGTVSKNQIISCESCPEEHHVHDGQCECRSNLTLSGGHCLPLVRNKPSLFLIKFENNVQVRSFFLVEHFNAAYHNCKEHNNVTACQVLANMCVMLLYRLDSRFTADDDACSEFMTISKIKKQQCNVNGNVFGLWLLYSEDAGSEMYKTDVPNVFTINPSLTSSHLQFVAAKYSVDGKFAGISSIKSHSLQPCDALRNTIDISFVFGTATEKKCEIPIQELWDSSKPFFYELYLLSNDKQNKSMLYPVPVLVKNMKVNGDYINQEDMSEWQLVKRFFISDGYSGIEAGSTLTTNHPLPLSKVFRYASDISLLVTLRRDGPPGSIFPPLLVIDYSEATADDYMRNKKVFTKFSVSYEMDQTGSERGISIAVGVLSALALLWTLVQTWSWFRRAGKQAADILTLGKFIVFLCGNLSTVIFVVIFCASLNWFITFKMQDVVHMLLPTQKQEAFLNTYLWIAFAMKAVEVIHLLCIQCNIDIFFIDWERPRNRSASVANRPASAASSSKTLGEASAVSSSLKPFSGRATPDKLGAEMAGISIWRTYFVANEWAEIQTMRKVNLSFQLFITLFFLKIMGFEEAALSTSLSKAAATEVRDIVPYSTCCRFAIAVIVYLAVALAQISLRKGIYERFIEDKLQQYVDLCSVSNVSVFILVSKRFGYYIHGRSAHGKADVNMKEMHELLRREEDDLCGHRGLLPNTEQQTFLMALPVGVYEQFKRLLGPLTTYSQAADRMQGVGGRLSKVDIDKVVSTYHTLNKFLAGFIEHAFKDLDYIVKDKVLLETLLDVELVETTERGFFYNDGGHSFDSVLFFGNESTLLLFDVLLFAVIDITSNNYVLAAILTYIIGKAIQAIRLNAGRINLVRKALVDERFLT